MLNLLNSTVSHVNLSQGVLKGENLNFKENLKIFIVLIFLLKNRLFYILLNFFNKIDNPPVRLCLIIVRIISFVFNT